MTKPKYYLTTAISYPNGAPHIGHAYEALATDAIARFQRLDGYDVYFLTGTDEHGIKMKQTAAREGLTPRQLAERNTPLFQKMVAALGCSNDDFIRTTEARHYRSSEEIWRRMAASGDIYKDAYAGWYSVRDEAYYAESETEVRPDNVRYGPQGTPVEWVEEESYFFRLSAYQDRLLAHYAAHPNFIGPEERRNEVVSFVKGGLKDLSISRTTFDWGIPVPGDPKHVMYVWVDALTNYITGVGFPDDKVPPFTHYWPADLHVIGKDIVRFHAVYWPAFLLSAGIALPRRVFAHGFLFNRGEKMSKYAVNLPRIWPSLRDVAMWVDTNTIGVNSLLQMAAHSEPLRELMEQQVQAGTWLAKKLGSSAGGIGYEIEDADGRVAKFAITASSNSFVTAVAPAVLATRAVAEGRFPHRGLVSPDRHVEPSDLIGYLAKNDVNFCDVPMKT